jgi:hypothetical protein
MGMYEKLMKLAGIQRYQLIIIIVQNFFFISLKALLIEFPSIKLINIKKPQVIVLAKTV